MGYGNIGPPMALHKQPSSCATCGLPLSFAGAPCVECTVITQHAGGAGWASRAATRRQLATGDLLEGKWRLEELLGAGGMGQVYRALDVALERTVAIKLLHEALCEDPESVARFEREARAMARLEHPHITPIHAVGQEGGRPFIVMKHLEGMSLARYLKSVPGPLPVAEVLGLARQVCAGLDFIHQRGCVHRDIKPGNVFLSPGGRATLLDFGILWEHRGDEATRSGQRLGTPSYMAPEQARGEPVDGRADLYSLGLVLLEMLTGLPPSSTCRLLGEGPRHAAQALREQAPWLTAPLAEVLVRATAMNPEQRHAGALALLGALEEAARVSVELPATALPARAPEAHGRRWRALSLTALGGAGLGALLFGMLALRQESPGDTTGSVTSARPDRKANARDNAAVPVRATTPGLARTGTASAQGSLGDSTAAGPEEARTENDVGTASAQGSLRDSTATGPATEASTRSGADTTSVHEDRATIALTGRAPPAETLAKNGAATPSPKRRTGSSASPGSTSPIKQEPPASSFAATGGTSGTASEGHSESATKAPLRRSRPQTPPVASSTKQPSSQARGELRVVTVHEGKMVWADVSVDGKHLGATPLSLDLPQGRHSVRVTRDGFQAEQRQVDVAPSTMAVVRIELRP
ncbi:protein kinase [Corallococcus exiguus]|uniref:serine/threonine-protein kinase n=1 Tax=Corallococcus exiguus TaxID=83462 RepID=UPI001A90720B|nr:serine/threonine-protein kinase [Corallococcus exiguus]MBN8465355.1 protein kinase [Corallococcus exiguus]